MKTPEHIKTLTPVRALAYGLLLPGLLWMLSCGDARDLPTDPGERTRGTGTEEGDLALLESRRAEIEAFIGSPVCTGPGDCAALPLGVKPCGGPWSWLVYSRSSVDTLALRALVDSYNTLNGELNLRWGWVSDCAVEAQPQVVCEDGVCREVGR